MKELFIFILIILSIIGHISIIYLINQYRNTRKQYYQLSKNAAEETHKMKMLIIDNPFDDKKITIAYNKVRSINKEIESLLGIK